MAGRNRGPPLPLKGGPHGGLPPPVHEVPFPGGGRVPVPHPALLEEMREPQFGIGARGLPPHPAFLQDRLASQHEDTLRLLLDNQRLSATHIALRQELEVTQYDLQRTDHYLHALRMECDVQMRELYEKSAKMDMDLKAMDGMRTELLRVRKDIKELTAHRQELTVEAQRKTQDLARMTADLQQTPALKAEIENLKIELQRARAAIENEKKGLAENFEHGQVMQKKLLTMAREVEKLRAEVSNAEKRARAAAAVAVANPGAGYAANYGNPDSGYAGNYYPASYGMNPTNPALPAQGGAEGYSQYGHGPGAWGAYDAQRAQGPR